MAFKDFAARNIPRYQPKHITLEYRNGSIIRFHKKSKGKIAEMNGTHFMVVGDSNIYLRSSINSVITF